MKIQERLLKLIHRRITNGNQLSYDRNWLGIPLAVPRVGAIMEALMGWTTTLVPFGRSLIQWVFHDWPKASKYSRASLCLCIYTYWQSTSRTVCLTEWPPSSVISWLVCEMMSPGTGVLRQHKSDLWRMAVEQLWPACCLIACWLLIVVCSLARFVLRITIWEQQTFFFPQQRNPRHTAQLEVPLIKLSLHLLCLKIFWFSQSHRNVEY